MYVQCVSTRRVKKIVEELCGMDISSTQVSRAAAELDEMLKSGSALKQPEGLLYLISNDETLPKALFDLQRLAEAVMSSAAGLDFEDVNPHTVHMRLDEFKRQAAFLIAELGKVYRSPTI